ncbi:MAG: response regulator transcription factor [Acidobacteria bacterium]|nr:response regulator transcription factor [Acidobacteriota bacterium]
MSTSASEAGEAPKIRGKASILVVEEQFVSEFLRSALTHQGYNVLCASPGAARAMLRREPEKIQVLVTNVPLEFAAFPDVPVLYLSACPDPAQTELFARALMLAKPFQPRLLFESVAQLLP